MTAAQNITRHFKGEWHGKQGSFPTPGHSAKDRGVTVKDADNGDVVFACHNDASFDWRAMKDECRKAGILPDFEPQSRDENGGDQWRETGRYVFTDDEGRPLYRTVRKEKHGERKRFVAQIPDDRGGWKSGSVPADQRVLYRLPDLIHADPGAIVYLVEGERKADKLAAWGLTATAIAFGCKSWNRAYAKSLAGRTTVILTDNDDEGRAFGESARLDIIGAGGFAHIVTLPGLPPKGDIMDWAGNGGSAFELAQLVDAAMNPAADTFALIDPAAWQDTETPPREWAINEWIPARQATFLTGAGSAGKSLLSQQLCTCLALGLPFMGIPTEQTVSVYLTCEDDADELHRRQKAICASMGVSLSALKGKLHLVSLFGAIGNELATFDPTGRMSVAPAYHKLRATVQATRAGFVTVDNVAHLFAGNEIVRNQVAGFCGLLNQLASEEACSVLFIGHPNKAGDAFSGSTAWENQVRSRLFLEIPKDDSGATLDPDTRTLSRGKANYARNGERIDFRWHHGAFVRDDDLPPNIGAEIAANVQASADNAVFLACLAERTKQSRPVSERRSPTYAPTVFATMPESKRIGKQRLEAAMDRLFRTQTIERAVLSYDSAKTRNIEGLREVSEHPRTVTPNGPRTLSPDTPERLTQTPPRTHPYINITGAAVPEGDHAPPEDHEPINLAVVKF